MSEIRNATITSTQIAGQNRGVLTCWVTVQWGGGGQSFGGYCLDRPVKDKSGNHSHREGTAYGMEFINKILVVLDVKDWESLKGVNVRIDHTHSGIDGIGHITKDNWFYPKKDLAHLVGADE